MRWPYSTPTNRRTTPPLRGARGDEPSTRRTSRSPEAKLALRQYLTKSAPKLVDFETVDMEGGMLGFRVTVTAHAKTYAFKHLARVPGLKDWVSHVLDPVSAESSG
jgi:hypothetical protein